jgi:hypothetical protein
MNCASARSNFASLPFSTTKRAPDILAAAAKSISPVASPNSTWSLGVNAKLRWLPWRRISTLPVSSCRPARRRTAGWAAPRAGGQLGIELGRLGLALLQRFLEGCDLGHQRVGALALALGHADLLAELLAPGLDALALGDGGAAAPCRPRASRPTAARGCASSGRRRRRRVLPG